MNEAELLREALERAAYYIERLETTHRGSPVRDLDEACEAWREAKRRLMPKGPAGDHGQVGWMGGEFDR